MKKTILSLALCATLLCTGTLNSISASKTSNVTGARDAQLLQVDGSEDPDPWG